jgi:hypothetical protein
MIFGLTVTPLWMIIGGAILLAMIVFQVLLGMRKIKFGRRTMAYHKYLAWVIVGVAIVHAMLGILFATGAALL